MNIQRYVEASAPWGWLSQSGVIGNCPDLETITFQKSYNTQLRITDCPKLRSVVTDFSGLVSVLFVNLNLPAAELNRIFGALPTSGGTITLTGVQGQSSCNTALATARNWTVAIN